MQREGYNVAKLLTTVKATSVLLRVSVSSFWTHILNDPQWQHLLTSVKPRSR